MIDGFDFSDVTCLDDIDILSPPKVTATANFPPPIPAAIPLPPSIPGIPPPPPPVLLGKIPPPPPPAAPSLHKTSKVEKKRTVRLFWKEFKSVKQYSYFFMIEVSKVYPTMC